MMARSRIALVVISLFIGLLVCSSETQALPRLQASATGGPSLGENSGIIWNDYWDPSYWTTGVPYYVEASDGQTGLPDYAVARAAITQTGVELSSYSYAPRAADPAADFSSGLGNHGYATSWSSVVDYFTLDTISGSSGAVLDAALHFNLTGTIQVLPAISQSNLSKTESGGTLSVDLTAKQGGTTLDSITIRWGYWVEDPSYYYKYFASNDTSYENLYNVFPVVTGSTYNFDVPLGLNLNDMEADEPITLVLQLGSGAKVAIADFSNTLKTDPDNPFEIISNPSGNSYALNSFVAASTVGLFGDLEDWEPLGGGTSGGAPVPEPSTILLFGIGLVGIAGVTRRKK